MLLAVDSDAIAAVKERLRRSPHVIDVSDVRADMNRLFDMNAAIMDVWTAISVALAASVVFGVVYNNARIAASARSRELASLPVLGFSRREVSAILLYGLARLLWRSRSVSGSVASGPSSSWAASIARHFAGRW